MSDKKHKEIVKCNECKWWSKDITNSYGMSPCSHPRLDNDEDDSFGVYDGEPFNEGVFMTGPNFGCIHGEHE